MLIDAQRMQQKPGFSEAKKALLEKRLQGDKAPNSAAIVRKRPAGGFPPLSPMQLRLWYLYQLDPEGPAYNYATALRIDGRLDIAILQRCIDEIVRRHEILRTTYAEHDGHPVQVIAPELGVRLHRHDIRHLPTHEREVEWLRLAKAEGTKPFDLSSGPVLRVTLIQLQESEFILLFGVHHIAYDGWSAGILLREFLALYRASVMGQIAPLPALSIQYADFAYWQHHNLRGWEYERQLHYWRQQLNGIPLLLELPSDRSRPAARSYSGATYEFAISSELTGRLRQVCRNCDCTLFNLLLGCFTVLLHRYSGEQDICVGIPFAGRMKPELENLIGFFINTVVIRTKLDVRTHFLELIKRVQATMLDAQSNQDVPFDKVVEELRPPRSQSYNPLFQVMFVLHNPPSNSLNPPGLKLEPIDIDYGISKFDLVLHATDKDVLEFAFEYSTELFDVERIARLADSFTWLLEVLTGDLGVRIDRLELLTPQQRADISKWNSTARSAAPKPRLLHHWFENQARQQPQAVAVICNFQTLSYGELEARANRLAHWLIAQNVKIETRVAICLERSVEMAIAVLAVLKAGGAYVPMNPAYPVTRLNDLLEDCGAQLLLTSENLATTLAVGKCRIFCLDRDEAQLESLPTEPVALQQYETAAAYVIYTSGSTGSPKGVLVTHGNAAASTWARFDYYREHVDGFLLISPLAFDSSVAGLFWTLSLGGRLCIPSEEELQDMEALTALLEREKLSHLLCLPSFHSIILDYASPQRLKSLRTVIVAGEACPAELVAKHYARLPEVRLFNEYGPTEAAVWSSVYSMNREDSVSDRSPAIGRPIANSQIHLLDANFNSVPIGAPGELYIGGAGLTRGYLDKPDLTAERFVPNPFTAVAGERLYKTGDLARYRLDGNLEFLGRTDQQVKIRGFRIEPGEIEAQILRYPEVSEVVVACGECGRAKSLIAYWVADDTAVCDKNHLQRFLKNRLPEYMIPAIWIRVEQLPRTSTGKIDRRALPLPDWNELSALQKTPPSTPIEQRLADIWTELLAIEDIGIHENFFTLGGDSIMVMQMISRARQNGLELKPQYISAHQTIAELALLLTGSKAKVESDLPVRGDVPLTPIQHWFFERDFANPHHWNQALMLEARSQIDCDRLQRAVGHLLKHHDALRLRFTKDELGWRQCYAPEQKEPVFHRIDLGDIDDIHLSSEIEKQASIWQQRLNITQGPLIRVVYFDTGRYRTARLLIVIHHLAVDGVSWRILLDDLQTLYRQLEAGQPLSLPGKTTSYQNWSLYLQCLVQSPEIQSEYAYWSKLLAERPPFPVDHVNGRNTEATSIVVTDKLRTEDTKKLLNYASRATETAVNEILLATLAKTLSEWSQFSDILIEIDSHGRLDRCLHIDLSRSVGWFTSVFPVLLSLPHSTDIMNTVALVNKQLMQIPNQGIGYGLLRYLIGLPIPEHATHHRPGSPVLFNYLGQLDQAFPKASAFALAKESVGACIDPSLHRYNEISVDTYITGGELHTLWTYSAERYDAATVQSWISCYRRLIFTLIEQ